MGVRKNAKFLTPTEIENFVKACVLMKADIVNPLADLADRYSKWDESVAIHWMIQHAFAPGVASEINFGHGGLGSYSFLSWHRYFLYQFEKKLQTYVPGVMIPYWDWTDPSSIMTDTFLGPNGTPIPTGYFAFDKPGVGSNTTIPLPAWWPASLEGWRLPSMFGSIWVGGLRRRVGDIIVPGGIITLPSSDDIDQTLMKGTYPEFQNTLESGATLPPRHLMHNGVHSWVGGTGGHMNSLFASPFDPFFYLHHCNIDRLWAMWQLDGHADEYPTSGGHAQHHRDDIMYPWTGGATGYGTNVSIPNFPLMPDFGPVAKHNADTLDFRNAFGYTYDTIAIIGLGLDRTGSMTELTPDPMVTTMPDVTKWEAAKRGVSAFLQDCETVQASRTIYVMAGIKTFRRLGANQFDSVFGAPTYGLVKSGTGFSKATFDGNVAAMTPGGSTPLADALVDVENTLVEAPYAGAPADEQRYMAFLTDGMLTSGALMSSIPDGNFSRTAIFTMGFGTGADVDYPTLASMVAKGKTLSTTQVFHGENAGTIDKFYSNALAAAIGFTSIFDPVIELFAGEFTHLEFAATSADDSFLITAQGMDFQDQNWSFMLHGPGDQMLYGTEAGHEHATHCHTCCTSPYVTSRRGNGRLSLVIQRGNTEDHCWVGKWELMISYKAKQWDKMMMVELGELLYPVAAGPVRGQRYARLLMDPKSRIATRNIIRKSAHGLDIPPASTNNNDKDACNIVVNISGRTNLKIELQPEKFLVKAGKEIKIHVKADTSIGSAKNRMAFARVILPAFDIADVLPKKKVVEMIKQIERSKTHSGKTDVSLLLADFEKSKKRVEFVKDLEGKVVRQDNGSLYIHNANTSVPGLYHFGVYVQGVYYPGTRTKKNAHAHDHADMHANDDTDGGEGFVRLLNITVAVVK